MVTSRATESPAIQAVLDDLRRVPSAVPLPLQPLSGEDLDSQILGLDPDLSPDQVAGIGRLTGGVPLYVEELVAAGEVGAVTLAAGTIAPVGSEILPEIVLMPCPQATAEKMSPRIPLLHVCMFIRNTPN